MDIKNKRYKIEVHQGWITDFKSLNIITTEYNLRLFEDDDIDIDIFYVTHKTSQYLHIYMIKIIQIIINSHILIYPITLKNLNI